MNGEGYEYDNESDSMRAALELARAKAHGGDADELAALEQRLRESWEPESSGQPDERVMQLPEMDLAPPNPGATEGPGNDGVDEQGKPIVGPGTKTAPMPDGTAEQLPPPVPPPEEPWARMKYDLQQNATRKPPADPLVEKMKAAGWSPKTAAGGGSPDWKALQEELQRAEHGAETSRTVGAMLHAAAPGFVPPANAGAGDVAAARAPLEVARQREESEARERQANSQLLDAARKAELRDPTSAASRRAQETYAARFGDDPRLVPAGLKQMSAEDIEKLTGTSVALHGQKNSADMAEARAKAAAEEKAKAAEHQKVVDERHDKERGEDVKYRGEQAERADKAAQRQDQMLALALKKDTDAQTQGLPANMELVEGANPAPEQLKDLGVVDRGADEVHRLTSRMRALLSETSRMGRAINPDTIGAFQQLQGEMTLALKDAGKLGQISAGDQALIDAIRPQATGPLANIVRDAASFEKQLKGMEQYADDKRGAAMKSIGVRHKGGGASGGKTVKVRFPNGAVADVPEADVEEATSKFKGEVVK